MRAIRRLEELLRQLAGALTTVRALRRAVHAAPRRGCRRRRRRRCCSFHSPAPAARLPAWLPHCGLCMTLGACARRLQRAQHPPSPALTRRTPAASRHRQVGELDDAARLEKVIERLKRGIIFTPSLFL